MVYDIRRASGQPVQNQLYLAVDRRSLPNIVQVVEIERLNRVPSRLGRMALLAD